MCNEKYEKAIKKSNKEVVRMISELITSLWGESEPKGLSDNESNDWRMVNSMSLNSMNSIISGFIYDENIRRATRKENEIRSAEIILAQRYKGYIEALLQTIGRKEDEGRMKFLKFNEWLYMNSRKKLLGLYKEEPKIVQMKNGTYKVLRKEEWEESFFDNEKEQHTCSQHEAMDLPF